MKLHLLFVLIFFLSGISYAQTSNPEPKEVYNKDSSKLIGLYNLIDCTGNGSQNFSGRISRLQTNAEYSDIYFEIGNTSFEVGYENLSNVTRSHLSDLIKNRNIVRIYACAGGSNGIWHVINIRL